MGSISSGVGLVSGLNHDALIESLMKIERRTLDQLKVRMATLNSQKAAFLDISARISGLLSRVQTLLSPVSFRGAKATSSNTDVLNATARPGAAAGSYAFLVRSLASAQHSISRGFSSASAALTPGTLTIESAAARVNRDADLNELNGYAGVQRGSIRIYNRAGASAVVDLTDVVTLNEVVERINVAGLGVTAMLGSDGLTLADATTGTGQLRVEEVGGGRTAADLGFTGASASDSDGDGKLSGTALTKLSTLSPLRALNDGLGIRRSLAGGDFVIQTVGGSVSVDLSDIVKPETRLARLNRGQGVELGVVQITARDGTIASVDLSTAKTLGDVETALESAFGGGRVSVTMTGSRLVVTDGTTVPDGQTAQAFTITDLSGHAARDLGLDVTATDNRIDGRNILRTESLADLLAAINEAAGNHDELGHRRVTAALASDGQRITLVSTQGEISLVAGNSQALRDLGLDTAGPGTQLTGRRIVGGLNTTLLRTLRGGTGLNEGTIAVTAGRIQFQVDLADAATLQEALTRIRTAGAQAGVELNIAYDVNGTRFTISSADGAELAITDVTGEFAKSLGLDAPGTTLRSVNLQRQYVGENTPLAALGNGRGVALGTLRITNSRGIAKTIDLAALNAETVGDVLSAINGLDFGIAARINDNGDGILVTDSAGGTVAMKIEDVSGSSARDLNLLGTATGSQIDGSFEYRISIGGADTLATLAARITEKTSLATGAVLNDGTGGTPYRLSIISRASGRVGELIIDDNGAGLGFTALTQARDARVLFGGAGGLLLTSSSNTFSNAIEGLSITASRASDQAVTVSVEKDVTAAVNAIQEFVTGFNETISRIRAVSNYNTETQERGVLLGDATLRSVESRMFRMISRTYVGAQTAYARLSQFGIRLSSGNELTFDAAAFRAAIAADPEGVAKFFSDTTVGVAAVLKKDLEAITKDNGLIPSRTESLDGQRELLEDRSAYIEKVLSAKEARLRREFDAMELALSQLQSQQTSLSQLATLTASNSSR